MTTKNPAVTYRIAELRLRDGKTPAQIIEQIKDEFPGVTLSREDIYKYLEQAVREGMAEGGNGMVRFLVERRRNIPQDIARPQ